SDFIAYQELRLKAGLTADTDSILQLKKETLYGNWYWANSSDRVEWNSTLTTLAALRILSSDSSQTKVLPRIRGYFLEMKNRDFNWGNTYQTMQIVAAILPGLLEEKARPEPVELILNHNSEKPLSCFPLDTLITGSKTLSLEKTGSGAAYLSFYQEFFNPEPQAVEHPFRVSTWFEGGSDTLKAGVKVNLHIELKVEQKGEYIMLSVPIPAGCSYGEQVSDRWSGPHYEYYKDHAGIFFSYLEPGTYHYTIELVPRYTGSYTLNPAVAEWMYFPVKYGRNSIRRVRID
ncbi:MAG: hypothetical protein ACOYXB_12320, partial [Bacteroidota bacterium]